MIYFIRNEESGAIKVGRSTKPLARLASLQTASADELEMIGVIAGGSGTEAWIHERLEPFHIRGEWFEGTREATREIDLIIAQACVGRNVREESERRSNCRHGLPGVLMRHRPTDRRFQCHGSMWGENEELLIYAERPFDVVAPVESDSLIVMAADLTLADIKRKDVPKYSARECVFESAWPVACCAPLGLIRE